MVSEEGNNGARDVLVVFFWDWVVKSAILDALWDNSKISVEGQELLKRRKFKFLATKLAKLGISYRWGFLFKLLIEY